MSQRLCVVGRVGRPVIHLQGSNLVCRLRKMLYEPPSPPPPRSPLKRKHKWNCSGLAGLSLSLQTECSGVPLRLETHTNTLTLTKALLYNMINLPFRAAGCVMENMRCLLGLRGRRDTISPCSTSTPYQAAVGQPRLTPAWFCCHRFPPAHVNLFSVALLPFESPAGRKVKWLQVGAGM